MRYTGFRGFIRDVIDDPHEYLPMLLTVGGLLLFWGFLCLCGIVSVRASTQRRRLWFALPPVVFGLIGVCAQIPVSIERDTFRFSCDLRWLFVAPLLIGVWGVASYWRQRHGKAIESRLNV